MSTRTTTEEHRSPSTDAPAAGRSVLLGAFPALVGLLVPTGGQVLGRAWLASVGVRDSEVSGGHVRFSRADGRVHVTDAGSRNGTWIDGARVPSGQCATLRDGAVLRLGKSLFVHRASFTGELTPAEPVGRLEGPWGLADVRAHLAEVSRSATRNVLIEGPTGTGKELVAAAVIKAFGREKKKYAAINVAAVGAGVFEAHLFGWVKGAFSGSAEGGKGVFGENDGGSVFLDEIGELPCELQAKLLRLIDNGEVQPVGRGGHVRVDVAIVAATNRSLDDAVARGEFRRDLHARFASRVALPPLANRPEDVFAILRALARRRGVDVDPGRVEVEAVERLLLDPWPANVRDLDRVAALLVASLPLTLAGVEKTLGPRAVKTELTREAAERMVEEVGGESEAARQLGVTRGKLRRRLGKA